MSRRGWGPASPWYFTSPGPLIAHLIPPSPSLRGLAYPTACSDVDDFLENTTEIPLSDIIHHPTNFDVPDPDFLIRWICSFLTDRRQRVKICDTFSSWVKLSGSMPQGSLLDPLTFIVLIDDLNTGCMLHKFVDDTTLSELINKGEPSCMDVNLTQLLDWSFSDLLVTDSVNVKKTK